MANKQNKPDNQIDSQKAQESAKAAAQSRESDLSAQDREAIKDMVRNDAENDTGPVAGAIYGHQADLQTAQNPEVPGDDTQQ